MSSWFHSLKTVLERFEFNNELWLPLKGHLLESVLPTFTLSLLILPPDLKRPETAFRVSAIIR